MSRRQRPRRQSRATVVEQSRPQEQRAPRVPNIRPGGTNFKPVSEVITNQMLQHLGPQANQADMYAPGAPMRPIPGLTPPGGPRGWNYPLQYNIAQLPRSTEQYNFADLRALASSYYGIQLAQQVWFDYVSKLELVIEPRPELMDENMDISDYEDDIQFYQDFFAYPDKDHDLHSWLQMAVKDQLEIDAVAIYVRPDKIGRPYSLDLIDGVMIKPLVDDRGRKPMPPWPAFEQFAYGLPATFLTNDQLIYLKETERTDSVYGRSRVEKIILNINIALRKLTKDLAHFTDGNLPPGFVTPSMDVQWSQDEIEAWEMQLNNLMAGNDELRSRIKVLPRGFEYKAALDPDIHVDMDKFILNIALACHGLTMAEVAFTDDVNRATGETQENVVYRRAMGPLMQRYAKLFTFILQKFFKETRFICKFKGFGEIEDFASQATAYSTLVTSGIQSPTQAARAMHLPIFGDIEVPPFMLTKTGPIMIDDLADPEVRAATKAAFINAAQQPAAGAAQSDGSDEQPGDTAAASGGAQGANTGQNDVGDALDAAMDEADQSLDALDAATRFDVPDLTRSDPVRGPGGEFGDYASAKKNTSKTPKTKAAKSTTPKAKSTAAKVPAGQRVAARVLKMATRFEKMAARKIGKKWTAAQASAANKMAATFNQIANAIHSGDQGKTDGLLDKAWSTAQTLFAGNQKSLAGMSHALTAIDTANDKGLLRVSLGDSYVEQDLEGDDEIEENDWFDDVEGDDDDEEAGGGVLHSRVAEALAGIDEIRSMLRARNITPRIVREDTPAAHTGMMLAFMLDPETAAQLALPDGEPANDLHVTISFLGDSADPTLQRNPATDKDDYADISHILKSMASREPTLNGNIGGIGRFAASPDSDGKDPVIALVDVPGLVELRTKLVTTLQMNGFFVAANHGYTPHCTLAYVEHAAPMPTENVPALPLIFDTLCLAIGDGRTFFRLGTENETAQQTTDTQSTESARQPARAYATASTAAPGPVRGSVTTDASITNTTQGQTAHASGGYGRTGIDDAVQQPARSALPEDQSRGVDGDIGRDSGRALGNDFRRWRDRAIADIKAGKACRAFVSDIIPHSAHALLESGLADCKTPDDVRTLFEMVRADGSDSRPKALASVSGGSLGQNKSAWNLRW